MVAQRATGVRHRIRERLFPRLRRRVAAGVQVRRAAVTVQVVVYRLKLVARSHLDEVVVIKVVVDQRRSLRRRIARVNSNESDCEQQYRCAN